MSLSHFQKKKKSKYILLKYYNTEESYYNYSFTNIIRFTRRNLLNFCSGLYVHYIVVELFLRLNIVARDNRRPRVSYRNNGGAKLHFPPPSPFFFKRRERERERSGNKWR